MNLFKKTSKGFTLIELLVVVAIIGILAATILAALGGARAKARMARAQSELSSMRAAAELYYTTNGGYADAMFTETTSGMKNLTESITKVDAQFPNQYHADGESWYAFAKLGDVFYCSDSNGYSGPLPSGQTTGIGSGGSDPYRCQ